MKIIVNQNSYQLTSESGINIKKLDKACLIFNMNEESGYRVTVLDKTNHTEAVYWTTDFLGLEQQEDDYFQTSNYLKLCKDFVQEVYNQEQYGLHSHMHHNTTHHPVSHVRRIYIS